MTRQEIYRQIKEAACQEEILNKFGRNFTQVKSDDLEKFLKSRSSLNTDVEKKESAVLDKPQERKHIASRYDAAFIKIVSTLQAKKIITPYEADDILSYIF